MAGDLNLAMGPDATGALKLLGEAQLDIGGRLVMPIGTKEQRLVMIERTDRAFVETRLENVNFVPLLPGTRV